MTRGVARAVRLARSTALNVGAALGLLVLVAVVAGAVFGVRPVVITSGSMEPEVSTGALVITRTVSAADLEVGDVVTVPTSTGSRVTHRIVDIDEAGSGVILTLRGDANPVPDEEVYPVSSADRMVVDVPLVGYVLSAMRSPAGLLVAGALTAALLLFLFSGGQHRGGGGGGAGGPAVRGRHRGARPAKSAASAGAGVLSTLSLTALLAMPSAAAWTDPVDISGTTMTAHTVPAPTLSCGALGAFSVTFNWTAVSGATGYQLTAGGTTYPVQTATTRTIIVAITAGTATVRALHDFGSTTWTSVASNQRTYTVAVVSVCS
jgi:signal peptidase I